MSQMLDVIEEPAVADDDRENSVELVDSEETSSYGQFDYTPMPVLAPIAAVLGVCSLIAFLGLFGILLSIVGILVGLIASWKVLRSQGALSGLKPSLTGLGLSLFSAIGGTALMAYNYHHEVPEGFERVSFTQQISKTAFIVENGAKDVHPAVKALVDKPIFLKGFMYPQGQEAGLTKFLMLKDSGECCFGGQPELQDMIEVRMQEGMDVDYYAGRVAVAGTFKINPAYHGTDPLEPLFLLEAEHFSKAKTAF